MQILIYFDHSKDNINIKALELQLPDLTGRTTLSQIQQIKLWAATLWQVKHTIRSCAVPLDVQTAVRELL